MTRDQLKTLLGMAIGAVLMMSGSVAWAEMITYQQGDNDPFTGSTYAGTEDVTLIADSNNSATADRNYGAATTFFAGSSGAGPRFHRRDSIRFDITSLDGQFTEINSVTLRLHVDSTYTIPDVSNELRLYRFTSSNDSWVEGTAGGTPQDGSACWNYLAYQSTTPTAWASGIAGTTWTDYEGGESGYIASANVDHTNIPSYYDLVFSDVSFISDWAAGNNPGLLLRVQTEVDDSRMQFYARNSSSQSLRPELIIDYAPVPEPSTLCLLVSGGLGIGLPVLRRRRKK